MTANAGRGHFPHTSQKPESLSLKQYCVVLCFTQRFKAPLSFEVWASLPGPLLPPLTGTAQTSP
jgi:hypothetical protein